MAYSTHSSILDEIALEVAAAQDRRMAEHAEANRQHILGGGSLTGLIYASGHTERMAAMASAMHWQGVTMHYPDDEDFRAIAIREFDRAGRAGLVAC